MIVFEDLEYCNILSVGNVPVKIDFTSPVVVFVGKNGHGKSSSTDALTFALYGKPFRSVNLPQLVNSINKKNLKVTLNFSIGLKQYKIIRGVKPNIFEIYVDGVLKEPPSSIKEYQNWFEKSVLKMNIKTFKQIVVLGSSSYVPFMELTTQERRNVIEEILDIKIFTIMNQILKQRISIEKTKHDEVKHKISMLSTKISMIKEHIADIEGRTSSVVVEYKEKIEKCNNSIFEFSTKIEKISKVIDEKRSDISDIEHVRANRSKYSTFRSKLESSIREIKKKLKHLDNNRCEYCLQTIEDGLRSLNVSDLEKELTDFKAGIKKADELIEKCDNEINEILDVMTEISKLDKEIQLLNEKISGLNSIIDLSNERILENENIESSVDKQNELIKVLNEYEKCIETNNDILNETKYFAVAQTMMRDDGVKSQIIKQYVPVINKLIQKYMTILDFNCGFEFDENFSETIKSRGRDKFSYSNFSDGEKARINLSLLFAFRELCKLKNSASCNLVVLDEMGGASLDSKGIDAFKSLVEESSKDKTNIIIISHDAQIVDSFDKTLRFSINKNGFTTTELICS